MHSISQLVLEVFKTSHNLNPVFMKDYFTPRPADYDFHMRDTLYISNVKSTRYGIKSLRFLGPKASAKRSRLFTIHCSTNVERC